MRALALADGERRAVILAVEVIGVTSALTAAIRADLAQRSGIDPDLVVVAATHTHSGPAGIRIGPLPQDPDLIRELQALAVETAVTALERLRPVRITHGHRRVDSLQRHRRHSDRTADDRVDIVLCNDVETRRPLAVLTAFACHPTVLDHTNLRYSGDWPGALARTLEAGIPDAVALVLTGACADINPLRTASDSVEVERFGQVLAGTVLHAVGELRELGNHRHVDNLLLDTRLTEALPAHGGDRTLDLRLQGWRQGLVLDLKRFQTRAEYTARIAALERDLSDHPTSGERGGWLRTRAALRAERSILSAAEHYLAAGGAQVASEMQRLQLDPGLAILTFPGEAASNLAAEARSETASDLIISAYSNDYVGYLVPDDFLREGGYEAGRTMFDLGHEHAVMSCRRSLLAEPR